MKRVLMLTGDVNLMNVTDPQVPFARITDTLRRADVLFGNLECCLASLGTVRGRPRLSDRDRPRRDRCGRRRGHGPRPALLVRGRDVSGEADLLRARQLLVPHRARRPGPWGLC